MGGITGSVLQWYKSYPSDWFICETSEGSDLGNVNNGVPQGAVLGTLYIYLPYTAVGGVKKELKTLCLNLVDVKCSLMNIMESFHSE